MGGDDDNSEGVKRRAMFRRLAKAAIFIEDDDFEWSDEEQEGTQEAKKDEDGVEYEIEPEEEFAVAGAVEDIDEKHREKLLEAKELAMIKGVVELTNKREKEIFTREGLKFVYPTEWQNEKGCGRIRLKIHMVMDGIYMRLFAMALVLLDIGFVIHSVVKGTSLAGHIISLVAVIYFLLELIVRVFAWGKTFFKDCIEIFDGCVVIIAFCVTVTVESIYFITKNEVKLANLIVILRFVRFALYIRIMYHTAQTVYMGMRYKAIQTKRMFVKDGFNLDLTYITQRIIAMSFPSSGTNEIRSFPPTRVDIELAIRNPKAEVVRFFNHYYPDGQYKIYNLCKERGYGTSEFLGQVERFRIVDHNVPKMSMLLDFCRNVEQYLNADEKNVMAVHCKGGKGRTGCCIASWLVYSKEFKTAKEEVLKAGGSTGKSDKQLKVHALEFYAGRRMDVAKGIKFQGVETPSQKRYVEYVEKVVKNYKGEMPPDKELLVKGLVIEGLDVTLYDDIQMEIVDGDEKPIARKTIVDVEEENKRRIVCNFEGINISGDVKFRFISKKLGKDYDDCAFFFWLHTSFIEKNKFEAGRMEIGNANKPKHHKKFNESFKVKLAFVDPKKSTNKKSLRRSSKKDATTINMEPVSA